MVPYLGRRASATGAAFGTSIVFAAIGCRAIETPFFDEGNRALGGTNGGTQGGVSGSEVGGTTSGAEPGGNPAIGGAGGSGGGSAGVAANGGAVAGSAAGSDDRGGTDSGGTTGAAGSGTSGADAGGGGTECAAIEPSAVLFDGHCYLFVPDAVTWAAARKGCEDRGAHLVTISSVGRSEAQFLAENAWVWQLAGMAEVWIGATDGRPSNQPGDGTPYAWITAEPMTFDLWSAGQPNNSAASCQEGAPCSCGDSCWEHCGFQWDPADDEPGTWNDRHCEHLLSYVCEWDDPPM